MGSEPTVPSVTISTRRPVRVDAAAGRVVVRVEGDLDLGTHEPLLDGLARGLALAEDVLVVDLAACHFLSSRSFRAIEDAADFLHARGGRLVVLEPPPSFAIISAFLGDTCAVRVQRAPHGEVV